MKKFFFISNLVIFLLHASSTCVLAKRTTEDETNRLSLETAVRQFGAQSANGQFNSQIFDQAQDYAQLMADNYYSVKTTGKSLSPLLGHNMISHNGFKQRCANFPGRSHEEILATVTARTPEEAAKQIVQNWYKSKDGHKESMMNFHQNFGYGLARTPEPLPGMAGYQWFAVGLFADGIKGHQAHKQQPAPKQPVAAKPKAPVFHQEEVRPVAPSPIRSQNMKPTKWQQPSHTPVFQANFDPYDRQLRLIHNLIAQWTMSLDQRYPISYRIYIHI